MKSILLWFYGVFLPVLISSKSISVQLGTRLQIPTSIKTMMQFAGESIRKVREEQLVEDNMTKVCTVDVPLPVTGGTELDDWPGGIKQKYSILRTMVATYFA